MLTRAGWRATICLAYQGATRPRRGPSPPDKVSSYNFDLLSARCADTGVIERRLSCLITLRDYPPVLRLSSSANKPKNCCETTTPGPPQPPRALAPSARDSPIKLGPRT